MIGDKTPTAFSDQIDNWINRLDKKVEQDIALTRMQNNDHLQHSKEVKETL